MPKLDSGQSPSSPRDFAHPPATQFEDLLKALSDEHATLSWHYSAAVQENTHLRSLLEQHGFKHDPGCQNSGYTVAEPATSSECCVVTPIVASPISSPRDLDSDRTDEVHFSEPDLDDMSADMSETDARSGMSGLADFMYKRHVTGDNLNGDLETCLSIDRRSEGGVNGGRVVFHDVSSNGSVTTRSDGSSYSRTRIFKIDAFWANILEGDATWSQTRPSLRMIGEKNRSFASFVDPCSSINRRQPSWYRKGVDISSTEASLQLALCDSYARPFVIAPFSYKHKIWTVVGLMFLLFDFVFLPIEVCFSLAPDAESSTEIVQIAGRIYWTLDIATGFITGFVDSSHKIESRITRIASHYIRTWFPFDITIVLMEWLLMGISELIKESKAAEGESYVSMIRLLRVLRLVRLARFARLRTALSGFVMLSSAGLESSIMMLKAIAVTVGFAHTMACVWHAIGDHVTDGWVSASSMKSYSVGYRYCISFNWLFLRIRGSSTDLIRVQTAVEVLVDTIIVLVSILLFAWLLAVVSQTFAEWFHSDALQLYRISVRYGNRNKLDSELARKVRTYLKANQMQGPGELLSEEMRLIKALPPNLQMDLQCHTRAPVICTRCTFSMLYEVSPRCLRIICHEVINEVLAVNGELIFARGDPCQQVYVVRMGECRYSCDESVLEDTPRNRARRNCKYGVDTLKHGALISEAALWTSWEHTGDLTTAGDAVVLLINVQSYMAAVESISVARRYSVCYARHFVWHLNRCVQCDVTGFEFDLEMLDQEVTSGTDEDHVAFVSHYKLEAGTEATLIRGMLEQVIRDDRANDAAELASPVFTDSEDLQDLARLRKHVEGSTNLVVLLTPGIFTRPWCLLEIVIAMRMHKQIVPVEVQRPGMRYKYPDDVWYQQLRTGKIVNADGVELLSKQGFSLEDVESAIRHLFLKIALPFSPHKSANVRFAEIADILKRFDAFRHKPRPSERARTL